LAELDPNVITSADGFVRKTKPDVILTVPRLEFNWPLSVGLSDLDPEIFLELSLEKSIIFSEFDLRIRPIMELAVRVERDNSIDPVVVQGMLHRTKELAAAGLVLPPWLRHAVSFETCSEPQVFPAAFRSNTSAWAASTAKENTGLARRRDRFRGAPAGRNLLSESVHFVVQRLHLACLQPYDGIRYLFL
jgi:hypothetical protein